MDPYDIAYDGALLSALLSQALCLARNLALRNKLIIDRGMGTAKTVPHRKDLHSTTAQAFSGIKIPVFQSNSSAPFAVILYFTVTTDTLNLVSHGSEFPEHLRTRPYLFEILLGYVSCFIVRILEKGTGKHAPIAAHGTESYPGGTPIDGIPLEHLPRNLAH